jgi:hypothetical protein
MIIFINIDKIIFINTTVITIVFVTVQCAIYSNITVIVSAFLILLYS